jgi:hypothetical protein
MTKLLVVLALALGTAACAQKVDCAQMKSKLDQCGAKLVRQVAGGENAAAMAMVSDDMIQSMMSGLLDPLNQQCKDNDGKFADAKEMNECLAKPNCDEFATCMAKHMK